MVWAGPWSRLVMTPPLRGGGPGFESPRAHHKKLLPSKSFIKVDSSFLKCKFPRGFPIKINCFEWDLLVKLCASKGYWELTSYASEIFYFSGGLYGDSGLSGIHVFLTTNLLFNGPSIILCF